jgi:hypothetical protein
MIGSLKDGKASGWDLLPNEALKHAPSCFVDKLVILYNRVLISGVIPSAWKRGRLVLVHKKGSTVDVYNYRPLTVLIAMAGLYSKTLNERLTVVVEAHRLLGETQNGFRKDRSGADCGFVLNSIIWKCMAKRWDLHLAFLDLQVGFSVTSIWCCDCDSDLFARRAM